TAMRADTFDVGLRYGSHSQMIEGSREERGECRTKGYGSLSTAAADGKADEILFGDIALDISVGKLLFVCFGESAVFGVAVHGDHSIAGTAQLDQSRAVRLSRGYLLKTGQLTTNYGNRLHNQYLVSQLIIGRFA